MNAFIYSIVFSIIGMAYLSYGKKQNRIDFMLSGLALLLYTFFISGVWAVVIVGGLLCAVPFIL